MIKEEELLSEEPLSTKASFIKWTKKYKYFIIIFILSFIIHLMALVFQWIHWGNLLHSTQKESSKMIKANLVVNQSETQKAPTQVETQTKSETKMNSENISSQKENQSEVKERKTDVEPQVDSRFQQELNKYSDNPNQSSIETSTESTNNKTSDDILVQNKPDNENKIDVSASSKTEHVNEKLDDQQQHSATMNGIKVPKQSTGKTETNTKENKNTQAHSSTSGEKTTTSGQHKQGIQLPSHLNLSYQLVRGDGDFTVGIANYDVNFNPQKQSYHIESKVETTGVFAVFVSGVLTQKSTGLMSEQGLKPLKFESIRTNREQTKIETVEFDWNNHKVYFKSNMDITKTEILSDNTQDMISLLYQFAFNHYENKDQMPITLANTRSLEKYNLKIKDNQTLIINNKSYKTIYYQKIAHENADKTEIWVSKDHHYLPVKIRQTDKKGSVMSFILNKINETQ